MIQPVLTCGKGTVSDLTVFLDHDRTTYDVYIGVALLERVAADPKVIQRKMLVGRLYNAKVPLRELCRQFGHDGRTIKKWGKALLSTDLDEMARAFAGRSAERKVTPELIRYGQQLYRERARLGRNFREAIISRIAEVFGVEISTTTASAIFASARESRPDGAAPRAASGLQNEAVSSTDSGDSVKQSPTPLPVRTGEALGGRQLIHHAGQVLFTEGMNGFADPLQRQFLAQILQGAVNVEQSKTLCGRSLSHFTGPVASSLKEQRDGLDSQACRETVLAVYKRNAELLDDGPGRGDLFYFDSHTKEYTGQLKVLKGWCGRRHGIVKTLNLDSFHTRSGRPCFIRHYSPYYDMRERFFMSLAEFDRLFDGPGRCGRTFVIDRGIYGLATLRAFERDYVITWEKNYSGGGWDPDRPVVTFRRSVTKNSRRDLRTTVFQCQQSPWKRDPAFRRIVVRATRENGRCAEVSVLSSHPTMDVQDTVWAIFRRWLQENDFKYLDTHFGLNQLTSRDSCRIQDRLDPFEDRPVESPEYRELRAQVHALEARLGKLLVRLRRQERDSDKLAAQQAELELRKPVLKSRLRQAVNRLSHDLPPGRRKTEDLPQQVVRFRQERKKIARKQAANARRRKKLQVEIAQLEETLEPLEVRLGSAIRKQSRLELLIQGNYRLLDARKKALMDALRVTASNIFRNVQQRYRIICDNHRDDHVMVRTLSRCSGTLEVTATAVTFELWLPGTLQPHRVRALETLVQEIGDRINAAIPTPRPVRIKLFTGPRRF